MVKKSMVAKSCRIARANIAALGAGEFITASVIRLDLQHGAKAIMLSWPAGLG